MEFHSIVDGDTRGSIGPGIGLFVDYWANRREPGGRPPLLASIKGYELAAQASSLVMFDAERDDDDGYRFRCREMGARHRDFAGTDLTGKLLEDVFEQNDARFFTNIYWGVLTTGRPHYWRRASAIQGREFETYERVIAPVEDPNHPLGTLIGLWQWTPLIGAEDDPDRPPTRRTAGGIPAIRRGGDKPAAFRLIVEAGQFPLAKDCVFETLALKSAETFVETLRPVLEPIWRGLATHRIPVGTREIALIEPSLDVTVGVGLDGVPLDRFDRFVDALRPRLEELRSTIACASANKV